MATVNGVTAERMVAILDQSVESASIQGSTLLFTRHDGSSFAAGDFAAFINSVVAISVNNAVPTAVAGSVLALGNVSGVIAWPGQTPAMMVNRVVTMTLVGNITINNIPGPPIPGTQIAIVMKQDATGGRTLTLANIKYSQGVLALSTAPNAIDIISFLYAGSGEWYAGAMGLNFL